MIIGAPLADDSGLDAGTVYVFKGKYSKTASEADFVFTGEEPGDRFGSCVGMPGMLTATVGPT